MVKSLLQEEKILNKDQFDAIQHGNGPLLIVAGAGTGKTTVITERIKNLILKKHIPASQVLALTFTDKAAREMEERIDVEMPYGYTQMWISTFHSFCDRILRTEAIHIGLNPSYKLMTEAEALLFLRNHIFQFKLDYFRPLGNPNKFLEGMLQHFSRLRDEDVSPKEYLLWAQTQNSKLKTQNDKDEVEKNLELANAYKAYDELKTKEGVMDFSDLISNTLKLFRTRKNILKTYQDQFLYILVDEFQDTNFAQNQLAILLAGKRKNITVVGDDDQAIYRWRGAAISNMIQFKEQFPKAKTVTLTQNYRSSQEILDSSHDLIQNNNPDRLEVKENINKKLYSQRKIKKDPVEFFYSERVEDEAEQVVKKIQELVDKDKGDYKDIAILVRANNHSQPFANSLERHNIPYQFLGPGRLFMQEEIKDLIAYLKVLYNFEDSVSLYRVLNLSIFNLDSRDIAAILNFAKRKNLNLFEAIEKVAEPNNQLQEVILNSDTKEKLKIIVAMIKRHLKSVPKESAGKILYYFLEDSGIIKRFLSPVSETQTRKYQNIAKFFGKLKTFEVDNEDARIFAVVDWIDLSLQMGESPMSTDVDWSENNAVNILTIHSSKGLEFPIVFLVNLVNQRFPTRERREQIPIPQDLIKEILPVGDYHLQEERRLFYVGMTRAKDRLFFTAANFYGEGKRERKISPFVYETLGQETMNKLLGKKKAGKIVIQPSLLDWSPSIVPSIIGTDPRPKTRITYLSYSQMQTFSRCPLHYKLQYILRIPYQPKAQLSFGSSVHSALRDFYQKCLQDKILKAGDIIPILEKSWIDEGYISRVHQKEALERAKYILLQYLKENYEKKADTIKTVGIEIPFNFFIKDSRQAPLSLKIAGRIDRVDKTDENKIEIIDYKTGTNTPNEKELKDDFQLSLYALAATKVNNNIFNKKPEDIILSLHYLEEEKKLTTTRTAEQLEEAKNKIIGIVGEIEKSDFLCTGSSICQNCEYKMLCHVS